MARHRPSPRSSHWRRINHANIGGSLITMMAFGIPGDAVTAVMLGALIIHGIQPGPLFATTHTKVAYGMFVGPRRRAGQVGAQ